MYMPFPYCLLFGDIKRLTIEAVAMPIIGGAHKIFDRKILADIAVFDKVAFTALVEKAKAALA